MDNVGKTIIKWLLWIFVAVIILVMLAIGGSNGYRSSVPQQQAVSAAQRITGFGATVADWNQNHVADPRFALNSAYNPDPSLPDQSHNDRYLVNDKSGGRVLAYEMRLPGTPSIESAKSESIKEFPADGNIVWSAQRAQCYQMEIQSNALAAVLSDPDIGDASGTAFVEFQSQVSGNDNVYDQANNNDIFFNLGTYPTAQDAPPC